MFHKDSPENSWMLISFFLIGGILGYIIGVWSPGAFSKEDQLDSIAGAKNEGVVNIENAPENTAKIEASEDDDAFLGNEDAPIVMVEFSDYQCPYCSRFEKESMPQIMQNYIETGKVKLVFRDYPLAFHANAKPAAEAAECAGEQDKYFEMHGKLFNGLDEWQGASDANGIFARYASEIGLKTEKFPKCMTNNEMAEEVEKDLSDGISYGVSGTPTFFINGQKLVGAQPYSVFANIFDSLLK